MMPSDDRIHRIGQEKKCNIYYMTANGMIDEKKRQNLKSSLRSYEKMSLIYQIRDHNFKD